MIFKRIALTLMLVFMGTVSVSAEQIPMRFTCYCPESCPGTVTASGEKVREGIIAASKDHMGDCAIVYTTDGAFIGIYECLDTGSHQNIKNGTAIDAWMPNIDRAKEMMALTRGKVLVEWIEKPKG